MPEISVDIESKRPVIAANLEELRYLVFHGMTGDTGQSAYELAVELGFAGTEQDWINSLHGANGTDGKDGKDGADGKNYGIVVDGSTDNVLELKAVEASGGGSDITVDPAPTENSENAVSSGGTYTALAGKANADVEQIALANGSGLYNIAEALTVPGYVSYANGNGQTSDNYMRTPFLYFPKGTKLEVKGTVNATSAATVAVYDANKTYIQASSTAGGGLNNNAQLFRFTMPADGYVRFSAHNDCLDDVVIQNITEQKELNILVLGNSFSQDAFAYLPPILNELLPDYAITYGVAYGDSYSAQNHIDSYNNDTNYTRWNLWRSNADHWSHYSGTSASAGKSLADILPLYDWDVVYYQSSGNIAENNMETSMTSINITPGRELLRILQTELTHPFTFLTGQWLSTPYASASDTMGSYFRMRKAMKYISDRLGVDGVIPVGAGIAFARTDATLDALGVSGHMLYDWNSETMHGHQQAGLPALISAYVIAQYILKMLGREDAAVYSSTFVPDTTGTSTINSGVMTHGTPDEQYGGVTTANIRKAQEIAVAAAAHPDSVYGETDAAGLPTVTTDDNGKVLKVVDGAWGVGTDETGGASAIAWKPLEDDEFDFEILGSGVSISASEAYYNEATGMVRFNLVCFGDTTGTVVDRFRVYFDEDKYYTPHSSGYGSNLSTLYYHEYPVGTATAIPVSSGGSASACVLFDNTTGTAASQRGCIEVVITISSATARVYVSGMYYTEKLPQTGGDS